MKIFDDVEIISKRGSLLSMSDEEYAQFLRKSNKGKIVKINHHNKTCLVHNGYDMAWFYLSQVKKINGKVEK